MKSIRCLVKDRNSMSTQEDRLTLLEQRVDALQRDTVTQQADNTRLLTILNKVVTTQELNYRELSENQTMLAGVISSQGIDIKAIKIDVATIKDELTQITTKLNEHTTKFDEHTTLLTQILERLK